MEKNINTDNFTDREWEELASMLSGEKGEQSDLLDRFNAGDAGNSGRVWKELDDMDKNGKIDVDKAWNKVRSRLENEGVIETEPVKTISIVRSGWFKVAAAVILLVGLGAGVLYLNNSGILSRQITVIAGNDQRNVHVSLPDGSSIYLNRNSELSYRKNFGIKERDVMLKGEAFFDIAPDKTKPFVIDAGRASVKVVGTSFNVITDNSDSAVEVFVKTGKVLVYDNTGNQSVQLDPGYVGVVNTLKSEKALNKDPNYLSWNTGYLYYDGQKLDVVFRDLKRVYNMDIVADDSSILDNPWRSPIDNVDRETIIRLICTSFNLDYTKDGDVYHLSKK